MYILQFVPAGYNYNLQFLAIVSTYLGIIIFPIIYTVKIAFQLPEFLIFLLEILFWMIFFPRMLKYKA